MTDRANLLCLVAFIIALTWRGDVLALPVLDQSHVPVSENAGPSITGDFTPAQTFTVGLTGQLTSIDVYMFASEPDIAADVTIEILLPVHQGLQLDVTGTPLASSNPVPGSSIPDSDGSSLPPSDFFVSFDLFAAMENPLPGRSTP